MFELQTLARRNAAITEPEPPENQLRHHPRIATLRREVAHLPVDDDYRHLLFRSINRYADQIVERPEYLSDEGWDDLEALQQVTLADMAEASLHRLFDRTGASHEPAASHTGCAD